MADRFMCYACGRFWHTGERPLKMCPYCGDIFFLDNIRDNIPPPLTNVRVDFGCGHCMSTDMVGDVRFCSLCGNSDKRYDPSAENITLESWQDELLKGLNL